MELPVQYIQVSFFVGTTDKCCHRFRQSRLTNVVTLDSVLHLLFTCFRQHRQKHPTGIEKCAVTRLTVHGRRPSLIEVQRV